MFTGIVETTGILSARQAHGLDQTLHIHAPNMDLSSTQLGDSIAVNGVCLTVTDLGDHSFCADVSNETLACTSLGKLAVGDKLNLEKALTLATPLGGHLVSGHVDGLAQLIHQKQDARSRKLDFQLESSLLKYVAPKGSITLDGVSLTVNSVNANVFSVNIIPHTQMRTTLCALSIGDYVNVEVDIIARYLERLVQHGQRPSLSFERLKELGF